jgi:hypothetical protein
MSWRNAWDLFGWKDCAAMVEPQVFLPGGRVVESSHKSEGVFDIWGHLSQLRE